MRWAEWGARAGERAARAWRRPRVRRALLAAAAVLLILRVALPSILRSQIEIQARSAIAGELSVGDVDLWLVRGAIALDDVRFRAAGRPADAPPLAAFSRLYVNLGWLSLLGRTVRLQSIELDDPAVELVREADGSLPLPGLAPSEPAPPAPDPAAPWNVEIDRLAVRGGSVRLDDRVPTPPAPVEIALDAIHLDGFTLEHEPDREPGRASLAARLGSGTLAIGATIDRRADGFWIDAKIDSVGLPLDGLQVHEPSIGWSRFAGRIDASVAAQIAPTGLPTAQGRVALLGIAVDVPGQGDPVLAWDRFEVEAESLDPNTRTISLARLELDRPLVQIDRARDGVVVLPLLAAIASAPAPAPTPAPVAAPAQPTSSLEAAPEAAPSATPDATAAPDASATPEVSATPTVTETTGSSAPPAATASPEPTPTPTAAAATSLAPSPTATPDAAASPPSPSPGAAGAAPPEAFPWDVFVHRAGLQGGKVRFVDRVVDPAESAELELDGISVSGFEIKRAGDRQPGEGAIELRFGDGTIKIDADVTMQDAGVAVAAAIDAANVPLDRLYLHVPQLGWSGFRGRLGAKLQVDVDPGALPRASGSIAIGDLAVDVPGEAKPVLEWARLEVDLEAVDPARQRAAVKRVALSGAGLEVRPDEPVPLPLLTGLMRWMGESEPGPGAVPPPVAEVEPAVQPPAPVAAEPGWAWSVDAIEVDDSTVHLAMASAPRDIGIARARVSGLSSDPAAPVTADLELTEGTARIAVRGDVVREPLGARATVEIANLALATLADGAPSLPVGFPAGTLAADLDVKLSGGALEASGRLSVADLKVVARDPAEAKDFASAWELLEIEARAVRVPGVVADAAASPSAGGITAPASPSAGTPGGARGSGAGASDAPAPSIDLTRVRLVRPSLLVTRTAEGIVLPRSVPPALSPAEGAPAQAAGAAPAPPATPTPSATAAPAPTATPSESAPAAQPTAAPDPAAAPRVRIARLEIEGGDVSLVDRTVQPFYRGRIGELRLRVRDLRVPEAGFAEVSLDAKLPGDAPLSIQSAAKADGNVQIDGRLEKLPLPPFNPYLTSAAGYSVPRGSADLTATAWWGPTYYGAWSDLTLADFDVAGAEGSTLFADQFGIPLSLALSLLRNPGGDITLGIPLEGDRERGASVALGPIVAQAITKALLGAITSPLKLIGAVAFGGDKVEAVKPAPIAFDAGQGELADDAWWRVDQLANTLASAPGLRVTLRGAAGGPDVRALQEAAVLADLEQDQGLLGALRTLGSRGDRNAVRDYLKARLAGEPAELEEDHRPALEEWVAAKTISDGDLEALAARRAEGLRSLLEKSYGVRGDALALGAPAVARDAGRPEVLVGLGG